MPRIESTFLVTGWEENAFHEAEGGPRLTRAQVKKGFSGGIEGVGTTEYLMVHRPDGTADFVGVERIEGSLDGKSGSFVLEHRGTFEGGTAKGSCQIVPGSGTGALTGLTGQGEFAATGPQAPFTLEYELDS